MFRILVINPGSTSTKLAVYQDKKLVHNKTIYHAAEELSKFADIADQYMFRKERVLNWLDMINVELNSLSAIVARGGLLRPIPSGVFAVNEAMLRDLRQGVNGKHASNLAALIGHELAKGLDIPTFVVDPVVVDEMEDVARVSGCPKIKRKSIFHALNQKAIARQAANTLNSSYEQMNFIVVHMGGGISVGVHRRGRVVDVNNALDGEGPFSPERAGTLPTTKIIDFCFQKSLPRMELNRLLVGKAGLVGLLGTNDARQIEEQIANGNKEAEFFYYTMAYQIAKEIGRGAAVLKGEVDAIVLTGGLAYSKMLVNWIKEKVSFISQVLILPGENEMEALALGALRVLTGEEKAKTYSVGGE